jgi:tetratricopeptide (TPR) repeat protein
LGICYSNLNELEIANEAYKQAALLAPNQIEPIVNLANNLTNQNRFQEAYTLYKKALLMNPLSALLHYNVGTLLLKSMKPQEAQIWLKQSLDLESGNASAWNSLGVALTETGALEDALHAYNQAIAYDPRLEEPLFNRHAVLLDLGNHQAAIASLEKLCDLNPDNPIYLFFLGMLEEYLDQNNQPSPHLTLLSDNKDVLAELESWEYLKAQQSSALMLGTNTKTIELGLAQAKLDGLVLEFGVYNGKSIRNIASIVKTEVHGFDSFEGIPENWNDEPTGSYSANGELPIVADNVTLHQGWFEDTIPNFKIEHTGPIRFMNIDCDLYSSTKTIFDLLGSQIVSGTVIVFDEYIGYKSWKDDEFKAFQEAVNQYQWQYEIMSFSFATKQVALKIL